LIPFFRERYGCAVGLSDHSGTIFAGLAAATLGIDVLEVHVTFSREMFGPDVPASVTAAELGELIQGIRFIEKMNANPVDKDAAAVETAPMRQLFTKSIVACVDLSAGTVIKTDHVTVKKPGTGIPAEQIDRVVGRRLRRDIKADQLIGRDDLEPLPEPQS
jgi:N,N'-diacetyllegionaminate synthase